MSSDSAALVADLRARLDLFERDMRRAGDIVDDRVRGIERRFETLNVTAAGFVKGLLAAFTVDQLVAFKNELVEIGRVAKEFGEKPALISGIASALNSTGASTQEALKGLQSLGERLNQARRQENDLSRLLEANNIAYKTRTGEALSLNDALAIAARLIANAGSEFDKIEIARMLGLSKEWIELLEKGPETVLKMVSAAEQAGGAIDDELVKRAEEFDRVWSETWNSFVLQAKAAFIAVDKARAEREAGGKSFASGTSLDPNKGRPADLGVTIIGPDGTESWYPTANPPAPREPAGTAPAPQPRSSSTSPTIIPGKGGHKASGYGADASALDALIERLQKKIAVQDAEAASLGRSSYEQAKARAEAELYDAVKRDEIAITDEVRAKIEAQATAYAASVERLKETKRAIEAVHDAAQGMGGAFATAIDGLVVQGEKLDQVLNNLLKSLSSDILRSLLTGQGSFGGLFGTAGQNGQAGGILGQLLSGLFGGARAGGGDVSPGKAWLIGERGPELFVPRVAGTVVPNAALRGGGGTVVRIQNYATQDVSETRSTGSDGTEMIDIAIGRSLASGRQDGALGARYGARPRTVRR
ncbi:hypothetical protein [Blastochloris tepida]|uniref:Tail tape measure protein n=1 Tax=Blastochloris tepida TaxID=2233851 RepID=A0A348G1F1_9HYPH|nr:hypothetical protein [Blastochloris tepida]BBF93384.1 hypothetical protein BLTE_20690 [Blastochloris tepida]